MQVLEQKPSFDRRSIRAALVILLAAIALVPAACSKKPEAPPAHQAKRYHLVGKVVSIDRQQASIMVDGQEIVGFMSAMTMPYPVRDPKLLVPLGPGDEITADVVMTDDGAYLENIVVTKKGDGKGPSGTSNPPQAGDKVPDFAMVNQDGKTHPSPRVSRGRPARHVHLHALPVSGFLPAGFEEFRADLRVSPEGSVARPENSPAERQLRSRVRHARGAAQIRGDFPRRPPAAIRFDRWQFADCSAEGFGQGRQLLRPVLQHGGRPARPLHEHHGHLARWHGLQVVSGQRLEARRSYRGRHAGPAAGAASATPARTLPPKRFPQLEFARLSSCVRG